MKWNFNFRKSPQEGRPKKSKKREWLDAVLFAVVAGTLLRGLLFSAYAIPSGSMEGSLLTGDYLFVSKISYGPRMPFTPVQNPFTESTITKYNIKTYWDGIQLSYHRLPGLMGIKRGDVVVFNKPEEADPVFDKPVDVRTNLIKRCQAIAGDVLHIVNGQVFINGKAAPNPEKMQTSYTVVTDGNSINPDLFKDLGIEVQQQIDLNTFTMVIPQSSLADFKKNAFIKSVTPEVAAAGNYDEQIYPHNAMFKWNLDNYGPIMIPKKGMTIRLNDSTMVLYRRAIELYENNKVEEKGHEVLINGRKADQYTFKMNYYWMMGDNRHNSLDSRFWGYVPEDHVIGKAMFTWMSIDSNKSLLHQIRWDRILKDIK
jgi:signal peptidase I